ncbi:MAG: Ycf48-like protein [Ignavibacteria bacterium]|nr:Ycf48-like protein [Ignavibacteria bacterium]
MKKYFTLISFSLLFFSSDIYSQWYLQYQSPSFAGFYDVRFINRYTGWSCGDGMILKTTNGGKEWIVNQVPYTLLQIHPVNDSVVYACGDYVILKTSNAGLNWITLWEDPFQSSIFNGLWFKDENTGWFCGNSFAMRTTDGGKTFIDSMNVPNTLHDIHFKNDTVGNIAAYTKMYRTTNSGVNWYPVTLPSTLATPFTERVTFQGDTGWTISWGRTVFRTTNYGVSWDSIANVPFGGGYRAYSIEFSSKNTGYCGGDNGRIYKSTDGGYNWSINCLTGGGGFTSIYSYNDSIVWGVGPGIRNTTNGGGIILNTNPQEISVEKEFELYQNYPNPFNSSTNIKFRISSSSTVKIILYNSTGKKEAVILNEYLSSGDYEKTFHSDNLQSGVYFYKMDLYDLDNNYLTETKKLLLIK